MFSKLNYRIRKYIFWEIGSKLTAFNEYLKRSKNKYCTNVTQQNVWTIFYNNAFFAFVRESKVKIHRNHFKKM